MLLTICVLAAIGAVAFLRWEIRMAYRSGYLGRRR